MNSRKRDGTGHRREVKAKKRIQFVVDLAHPAKTGRHDQAVGNSIRIGEEESRAKARFLLQTRERIVYMDTAVAARNQVVFITPEAAVEFLLLRQVVVNREAPVGLPNGEHALGWKLVIRQSGIIWCRNESQKACRNSAETRSGNLVAGPLLACVFRYPF